MSTEADFQKIQLAAIREATKALRTIHHELRHPHNDHCAECITLAYLEEVGF